MTTSSPLNEILEIVAKIETRRATNKLDYYQPYPYQERFHFAEGHLTPGVLALQRALIAANKIGKTFCAAMEVAMHVTGRYPEWWKGHRYSRPVTVMCAGNTNDTTRDILQTELFGDPEDDAKLGTGTIPKDAIYGRPTRKPGVQNAFESVLIRHKAGGRSKIVFKAYEMGFKKFMGKEYDIQWLDEEPPIEVWSQIVRATFAKRDALIFATFTPEEGMTQVVRQFMQELARGQALVTATWDDAPHMTADVRAEKLASIPKNEWEMRSKGTPLMGAGLIFPYSDDQLLVEPFAIPAHWPQIIGTDFGWDHPFAGANLAWDRDDDCVYLTNEYRESKAIPAVHASALKDWGDWKVVAWPHDGLHSEKSSGDQLVEAYRKEKLNMTREHATNPPDREAGHKEGEGGISVEKSLFDMQIRMEKGKWKVFKTCRKWIEEKNLYHRDTNGKIVKLNDDVISASRTAHMMLRHSQTKTIVVPRRALVAGYSNW